MPAEAAARAAGLLGDGVPGLRRVPAERMHLTLAFLGALPTERLDEVVAAVTAAARGSAPCALSFDRLGRFPPAGRPATIWLGLGAGGPAVERLAGSVRAELERRALDFDRKPARPHLTLARVRPDASPAEVRAVAVAIGAPSSVGALGFEVRSVAVVESVLTARGPRYAVRADVPLDRAEERP